MRKISVLKSKFIMKNLLNILLTLSIFLIPCKTFAQISQTEINGELINTSNEFLRDLDYETWQLVAYKSTINEGELILRIVGYPGSLRIDHPLDLNIQSGRKEWILSDKTLSNESLANDNRQAAAEFDLDELIKNISKNRPLRLSLPGVITELPVPPFLVQEWRSLN